MHAVGAYDLGPHTLDQLLELTASMPSFALYGFPSMLEFLAQELLKRGDRTFIGRVRIAWMGGETLTSEQANAFELAFGTPLLNHYGGRELSAMASQWRMAEPLEVLRPNVVLELLGEDNMPVASGTPGRIICTSLVNGATPFLRYEIGDVGVSMDEPGPFGVTTLSSVLGRTTEIVRLPSGKVLHGIYWYGMIREHPEIVSFQVRWNERSIKLLLVSRNMSSSRRSEFEAKIRTVLDDTPCTFEYVAEIPRTKEGKLLRIVRE